MKKIICCLLLLFPLFLLAQDEDAAPRGFRKENLFTGGGLGLGFGNNYFQAGVNPMLGYSINSWLDAGIVANYNYASFRDWNGFIGKVRQTSFGGGAFTRIYPFRPVFIQAQYEINATRLKYLPSNGGESDRASVSAPSLLLGVGYAGGRLPGSGQAFGYLSLMIDVLGRANSPYVDSYGSAFPVLRGGIQIPLFQGRDRY